MDCRLAATDPHPPFAHPPHPRVNHAIIAANVLVYLVIDLLALRSVSTE
jgi:hypothetical protein